MIRNSIIAILLIVTIIGSKVTTKSGDYPEVKPFNARKVPLEEILNKLCDDLDVSYLLVDADKKKKVSFSIRKATTLDKALDILLTPMDYHWEYIKKDNLIVIKKKPEKQFKVKIYSVSPEKSKNILKAIKEVITSKGKVKLIGKKKIVYVKDEIENIKVIDKIVEKMNKEKK